MHDSNRGRIVFAFFRRLKQRKNHNVAAVATLRGDWR